MHRVKILLCIGFNPALYPFRTCPFLYTFGKFYYKHAMSFLYAIAYSLLFIYLYVTFWENNTLMYIKKSFDFE